MMREYTWSRTVLIRNFILTLLFLVFVEYFARFGNFLVVVVNLLLLTFYASDLFLFGGVISRIAINDETREVTVNHIKWLRTRTYTFPASEFNLVYGLGPGKVGLNLTALRLYKNGEETSFARIIPDYHGWSTGELKDVAENLLSDNKASA